MLNGKRGLAILVGVQAVFATVFLFKFAASVFGLLTRPIPWELVEFIEIGAALGLVLGTCLGAIALRRSEARRAKMEDQLRLASGAFAELMHRRFDQWALTPAERDVALFTIKGLSLSEIAGLRGTSEGTIKAQSAAVYRKAGVGSRAALVSSFIEDLMGETLLPPPSDPAVLPPPSAAEEDEVELALEQRRG